MAQGVYPKWIRKGVIVNNAEQEAAALANPSYRKSIARVPTIVVPTVAAFEAAQATIEIQTVTIVGHQARIAELEKELADANAIITEMSKVPEPEAEPETDEQRRDRKAAELKERMLAAKGK